MSDVTAGPAVDSMTSDTRVRAEFDARRAAGEKRIILWRGEDDELHVYTRAQLGPRIVGFRERHADSLEWVMRIFASVALAITFALILHAHPEGASDHAFTVLVGVPLVSGIRNTWGLLMELRAEKLRSAAGLPTPA